MVTIHKDYLTSRAGIIKYVEMGLALLVIILSSVTCADGSLVAALTVIVTIICLIGCIVVFVMRLLGYFFYNFEFCFLIVVSIGMLIGSISHFAAAHGKEDHKMIFILSGALMLIVAILCIVDFVILKFLTKTADQEQERAAANKSADNSAA